MGSATHIAAAHIGGRATGQAGGRVDTATPCGGG